MIEAMSSPAPQRVLAFDYGMRRIGVAVGQQLTRTARPLTILAARDGVPDWQAVGRLLDDWKPHRLLVGHPLNMDGTDSDMSRRARKFANRLHGRFGLPVDLVDERLTSFVHRSRDAAGVVRGDPIDALAAATLCEDWLRQT